MSGLNPKARALLAQFGQEPGVTPDQVANLQAVIGSSPVLTAQVNAAVAAGHLEGFEPLPAGIHAGGEYHPGTKTIRLPLAMLTTPQGTAIDMAEPVFVLGHELQHGLNRLVTKKATEALIKELEAEAKTPAAMHDYTAAIEKRLAQNRRDEADAEISGWNALVDHLRGGNPNLTLKNVYKANAGRMVDFIDVGGSTPPAYTLKPNLKLNPDMSMDSTSANIEAMGVNYFDKAARAFGGPVGLGHLGHSDYANYYGTSAISAAAQVDTRDARPYNGVQPKMVIDMQQLGLDESLLEENGLFIGRGNPRPKAYYDSSHAPHARHHFDHTYTTHAYVPIAPGADAIPIGRAPTPDGPRHPDHALLEQIRSGVRELDREAGRSYDDTSERISRSLLARCKDQDRAQVLTRVDHVVLGTNGENIFAVQGRMDDPAHSRVHVPVVQATQTPVEQSDQKLEAANQRITREQVQEQQLAQQPTQRQPDGIAGPTLRM